MLAALGNFPAKVNPSASGVMPDPTRPWSSSFPNRLSRHSRQIHVWRSRIININYRLMCIEAKNNMRRPF